MLGIVILLVKFLWLQVLVHSLQMGGQEVYQVKAIGDGLGPEKMVLCVSPKVLGREARGTPK